MCLSLWQVHKMRSFLPSSVRGRIFLLTGLPIVGFSALGGMLWFLDQVQRAQDAAVAQYRVVETATWGLERSITEVNSIALAYVNRPSSSEADNFADRIENAGYDIASIRKASTDPAVLSEVEKIEAAVAGLKNDFGGMAAAREALGTNFQSGANGALLKALDALGRRGDEAAADAAARSAATAVADYLAAVHAYRVSPVKPNRDAAAKALEAINGRSPQRRPNLPLRSRQMPPPPMLPLPPGRMPRARYARVWRRST